MRARWHDDAPSDVARRGYVLGRFVGRRPLWLLGWLLGWLLTGLLGWLPRLFHMSNREFNGFSIFVVSAAMCLMYAIASSDSAP